MRILVYGAGVLGSLYAARLHDAGHDVTVLARGERYQQIKAGGVLIQDPRTGVRSVSLVPTIDRLEPDAVFDAALVLTRRDQVRDVLPPLAAATAIPTVLLMTNNALGADEYVAALGRERVLLGFPGAGGVREGDVVRARAVSGMLQPTTIGELDGTTTPRVHEIADVLRSAGFPVAISPRIEAWLTTHAAIVTPAALAVYAAGGTTHGLARTPDALVLMIRAVREELGVLRAAGVTIEPRRYRRLFDAPEPVLVAILRRSLASDRAELGIAGHARVARAEMRTLLDELRTIAARTEVATPSVDRLASHLDEAVEPIAEGSHEIPVDRRPLRVAATGVVAVGLAAAGVAAWAVARRRNGSVLPHIEIGTPDLPAALAHVREAVPQIEIGTPDVPAALAHVRGSARRLGLRAPYMRVRALRRATLLASMRPLLARGWPAMTMARGLLTRVRPSAA